MRLTEKQYEEMEEEDRIRDMELDIDWEHDLEKDRRLGISSDKKDELTDNLVYCEKCKASRQSCGCSDKKEVKDE